jgi:hypothetical protein
MLTVLIGRRPLRGVNYEDVAGSFDWFKFQADLLLYSSEYAGCGAGVSGAQLVGRIDNFEIVSTGKAGLVHERAVEEKPHGHNEIRDRSTGIEVGQFSAATTRALIWLRVGVDGRVELRSPLAIRMA